MPSNPLSYLSLKCVLEYLEAVKRLHITARSARLQRIDKLVPIRMDIFNVDKYTMTINKLSINLCEDVVFNYIRIRKNIRIYYSARRFLRNRFFTNEEDVKKMIDYYLVGRPNILLNQLDANDRMADFTTYMKLRVNCLNISDNFPLESTLPMLHPICVPLKSIRTTINKATISDHPIIKSARTLILSNGFDAPPESRQKLEPEDIEKLDNKKIVFEDDPFSSGNFSIFAFINYLKRSVPTGKTYIILQSNGFVTTLLSYVKMGYDRYSNPLDTVQERFIPGAPRFLIPINYSSNIQVYGIEKKLNEFRRETGEIVIKVVPAIY